MHHKMSQCFACIYYKEDDKLHLWLIFWSSQVFYIYAMINFFARTVVRYC